MTSFPFPSHSIPITRLRFHSDFSNTLYQTMVILVMTIPGQPYFQMLGLFSDYFITFEQGKPTSSNLSRAARYSVSIVETALCQFLSIGIGDFRPLPRNRPSLSDRQKFITGDYVCDLHSCSKFGANMSMEGFWAKQVKYNHNFIKPSYL